MKGENYIIAFQHLGLKEKEAEILLYIMQHREGVTQFEMESVLDIRQPEISLYMKKLLKRKWISIAGYIKKTGRSRPISIYVPRVTPEDLANELRKELLRHSNIVNNSITTIESLNTA